MDLLIKFALRSTIGKTMLFCTQVNGGIDQILEFANDKELRDRLAFAGLPFALSVDTFTPPMYVTVEQLRALGVNM